MDYILQTSALITNWYIVTDDRLLGSSAPSNTIEKRVKTKRQLSSYICIGDRRFPSFWQLPNALRVGFIRVLYSNCLCGWGSIKCVMSVGVKKTLLAGQLDALEG